VEAIDKIEQIDDIM